MGTRIATETELTHGLRCIDDVLNSTICSLEKKRCFESPYGLYEFQSDVADNYDYDPNNKQADYSLDNDGEDVEPAAKC